MTLLVSNLFNRQHMMHEKKWIIYLVRCSDNYLYCEITNDLETRLMDHNSGKGAKYTRSRRPVELVGFSSEMSKSEALKLENKIKRSPAHSKLSEKLMLWKQTVNDQGVNAHNQGYRKSNRPKRAC
jgi:putative endonuclease